MEATSRVSRKNSLHTEDNDLMKVNSSIPNNDTPFSLEDLAKKSIYSSYRSRDDRFETLGFARKQNKDFDTRSEKQSDKRAYSVKGVFPQKTSVRQIVIEKKATNDYNQNLFKLKLQEMTFKFKTKIATILKSLDISLTQFSRFTSLNRIDDILDFLSESVKKRLNTDQASKNQNFKTISKQRELIFEYQQQIENLKKKQAQKDTIEKTYKTKLKQSHAQIRDLYDKINQKERQISQKMTEIYQLKSLSKQSDKLMENYKLKCLTVEKQLNELMQKQALETKKLVNNYNNIQEQNLELKQKNDELAQILKNQKQKESKILSLNQHLSEEIQRWKERLSSNINSDADTQSESRQSRKTKQNDETYEARPLAGKLSTLTLENQITRLNYKIKELQKQNRHLSRQLINYLSIKQKYDELLSFVQSNQEAQVNSAEPSENINQQSKQMVGQQKLFEVQYYYKKKIEEIVKQWRDKLVQIISKSQQEQQKYKIQILKLQKTNEELESKVYQLANEKYLVQNKLIEKERELYEMSRNKNDKKERSNTPSIRTQTKSEVLMTAIQGENNNQESIGLQSIDEKNI